MNQHLQCHEPILLHPPAQRKIDLPPRFVSLGRGRSLYVLDNQLRKGAWPRKTNLRGFTLSLFADLSRRSLDEGGCFPLITNN
jgi:hypothetical protein